MPSHSTRRAGGPAKNAANCATCAAVCCRLTVVLEDGDNIPSHLTTHLPQGHRVMAHSEEGWCVAMDSAHMNCSIYEHRPAACRRFVMGGPYCKAVRSDYVEQRSRSIEITLK